MATILESSEEFSMILRHSGMMSVLSKKLMTSAESFLTRAPMTPKEVNLRYSKVLWFEVVDKNGNRKRGMCACRNWGLISWWEATHWRRTKALQTRFESWFESAGGDSNGYTDMISFIREVMTPKLDHNTMARSSYCSLFLPNSRSACSLLGPYVSWQIQW